MMRSIRFVAAISVVLSCLFGAPANGFNQTVAAFGDRDYQGSMENLGACVSSGGTADVLLLIDRSGSLRSDPGTDPTGVRVDASQYLVRQFGDFVEHYTSVEGDKPRINVAAAGFDSKFELTIPWRSLSGGNADRIAKSLESFRTQDDGIDTDYWSALSSARAALSKQASEPGHCALLVWFSDGEYNLSVRSQALPKSQRKPYDASNPLTSAADVTRALSKGEEDLCRNGGIADQLRVDSITTVAIGLSNDQTPPDFGLMKKIAVGSENCGTQSAKGYGAFFPASNVDGLYFAFDAVARPGAGGSTSQTGAVCPTTKDSCRAGRHTFVLDPTIGSVHGLGSADRLDGVVVRGPDGGSKSLPAGQGGATGEATVSGQQLKWTWLSDHTVSLDLSMKDNSRWSGAWSLTFVGPDRDAISRSSLHLYGDIKPVWNESEDNTWHVGEAARSFSFGLDNSQGTHLTPSELELLSPATTLMVEVIPSQGSPVTLAAGLSQSAIGQPQSLSLSDGIPIGQAQLRLTLNLTTRGVNGGPGTELEPQVVDYPVQIGAPTNYPSITSEVDFGSTEGSKPVSLWVPIKGEGCVWLAGSEAPQTLPLGTSGAKLSSSAADQSSCAEGKIKLTLVPDGSGNGLLSGKASFMATGAEADSTPQEFPFEYRLSMSPQTNVRTLWLVFAAVIFAGLAIPLAMLYLVKFLTAKVGGQTIQAGSIRGRIDENTSFLESVSALTPTSWPVTHLDGTGRRRVNVGEVVLCAKTGLAPTETGYVLVEQVGMPAAAGDGSRKGDLARLPLAVAGAWCVALDQTDPRHGEVTVTFFTTPGASRISEQLDSARSAAPELVAQLRSGLKDSTEDLIPGGGVGPGTDSGAVDDWGSSWPGAAPTIPDSSSGSQSGDTPPGW